MPTITEEVNGRVVEYKIQNPPKKQQRKQQPIRSRRSTGRSRRRRGRRRGGGESKGQGGNKIPGTLVEYSTGRVKNLTQIPATLGLSTQPTYHRSVGRCKNKEYGIGDRMEGCAYFGLISSQSLSTDVFIPGFIDGDDFSLLLSTWQNNTYLIHPYNIPRLNRECQNWGRYAWRECRVIYTPLCGSGTTGGFALSLTRDWEWVFTQDGVSGSSFYDISQQSTSFQTPFWMPSQVTTRNYESDRTFSTSYPLFSPTNFSAGNPGDHEYVMSALTDVAQLMMLVNSNVSTTIGGTNYGTLRIEYVIDLYLPRNASAAWMVPMSFPALTLDSNGNQTKNGKPVQIPKSVLRGNWQKTHHFLKKEKDDKPYEDLDSKRPLEPPEIKVRDDQSHLSRRLREFNTRAFESDEPNRSDLRSRSLERVPLTRSSRYDEIDQVQASTLGAPSRLSSERQ